LGGWRLAMECRMLPLINTEKEERCPVGHAVVTGPGGSLLQEHFDWIVHTVPPFFRHHPDPEEHLMQCYRYALALAFDKGSRVACPLLGAGARGFPLDVALNLAGQASLEWRDQDKDSGDKQLLAFAIPDTDVAEQLVATISKEC
jgi:O-acetyl-ADP-ribose deacetylase (regulator of RNase III)